LPAGSFTRDTNISSQADRMGPCDFPHIETLKKHVASKRYATEADVKQAVTSCFQTLVIDFF
jgi:hypothetical protein